MQNHETSRTEVNGIGRDTMVQEAAREEIEHAVLKRRAVTASALHGGSAAGVQALQNALVYAVAAQILVWLRLHV